MKGGFLPILAIMFLLPGLASAASVETIINPSGDGYIISLGSGVYEVKDKDYLLCGSTGGVVKFSLDQVNSPIESAILSVNPKGLPIWDYTIEVYGYGSEVGYVVPEDRLSGTYIGTLTLPENITWGEDAYFDVTDFISEVNTPFAAFNLRTDNAVYLSSLELNDGHPSQLIVSTVPVPAAIWLLGSGLIGLFGLRNKMRGA